MAGRKINRRLLNGSIENSPGGEVPFEMSRTRNELAFTLNRSMSAENRTEISWFRKVLMIEHPTSTPPVPSLHPREQDSTCIGWGRFVLVEDAGEHPPLGTTAAKTATRARVA